MADVERLGWPASPVVGVRWLYDREPVKFDMTPGSLAQAVAGRHFIAVMLEQAARKPSRLLIIGPDGTIRREVSDRQMINGKVEDVGFGWFEKPASGVSETFGVVVSLPRGVTYQLDVSAVSGDVVHVKESR